MIIDVVPYAKESIKSAKLAKSQGRDGIVIADEFCHWSKEIADAVIYAPSKTSLFLQLTTGLNLVAKLFADLTAEMNRDISQARMSQWLATSRGLGLFM